jgi:hypothetical protein
MWVFNTPSQVVNELACWYFTLWAIGHCPRCKWADALMVSCRAVFAGAYSAQLRIPFLPKISELALGIAAF